ncbi:MAG: phage major capsid protein [Bacteroidales bacterium]|nr:phage major capsid protein [Bacteroidales bacterium]
MREIRLILEDLQANLRAMQACDPSDAQTLEGLMAKDKALKQELEAARAAEEAERLLVARTVQHEAQHGNEFSLVRFIAGVLAGRMEGFEAEMAAAGADEYRHLGISQKGYVIPSALLMRSAQGQNAGTAGEGGNLKITTQRYIEDVKEKLVVSGMGASVLTGLVGSVDLPSVGNINVSFLDEAVQTSTKVADVAKVTLSPRGIRANMVTTRDLMKQTSIDVERILMDRLSDAEAACIDKAALAAIVAAATSAGSTLNWANIVAMETALNAVNANRGSMGYVLPSASWGLAKTTLKSSGVSGYILDADKNINGYKADFANQLASGVVAIFGNFRDLYIGRWGGIDLLVDPYSLGDTGEVKIQLYSYADAKVAFAKSFSKLATAGSGSGDGSGV